MSLRAELRVTLGALELDVSIEAATGEVVALVGPNGAGKTTVLRAIAGLVPLDAGRVELDGEVLTDAAAGRAVPTEQRSIGYVFQDHLLFPHLSALENVAFGLRCRGVHRREARARAGEWLERVGLEAHHDTRPRALSGGQAQRVALARALAVEPRLLLLDEPTAALDATSRSQVRAEVRRHLRSFEGTRLLVTHDPVEAMALADRIVVLENGRMTQSGSPADTARRPVTSYVADLVGVNLLEGSLHDAVIRLDSGASLRVTEGVDDGRVLAVIHPRAVTLHRNAPESSARNVWQGTVQSIDHHGDRCRVAVGGDVALVAEITTAALTDLQLGDESPVWLSVKATEIEVYPSGEVVASGP